MAYIAMYWGVMIIGYFIGSKCRKNQDKFNFVGLVMTSCICALVLLMGIRMGTNEEVISNLGSIGLEALLITVLLMAGAVISITITRKLFKIDKFGNIHKGSKSIEDSSMTSADDGEKKSNLMTYLILICVVIGLLLGYFVVRTSGIDIKHFEETSGNAMIIGLCFMLVVIGFDMGLSGTVVMQLKQVGLRIFVFPIAVLIGTTIVAVLCGLFLPLTVRESLAVSYGFGWYTFAPVAISNTGHVIAGAVSFMHNVFREIGGIVLIPILAKKIGYIEVTGLAGVAGMDIGMPIVEKSTRTDIITYSFIIGMFESFLVPILVPIAIGG